MKDIKYLNMLLNTQEQHFFCCVPKNMKEIALCELQLEDKLLDETMKPFVPSGHAFVTFDSSLAADACLKKF